MEEDREMVLSKLLILWLIDLACSDDVCPQNITISKVVYYLVKAVNCILV